MSVKIRKTLYVLMILLGLSAALLVVFLFGREYAGRWDVDAPYSDILLRYDGWTLQKGNGVSEKVKLPAYVPTAGSTVMITNTLPRALESGTYLVFESTNVSVAVSIDGETVYRSTDKTDSRPFSMWHYVPLDAVEAEGRVILEFSGGDPYDMGILPEIYLGPRSEILLLAENGVRLNTQISVSTVFFGVFVMLCALVTFSNVDFSADFVLLGLFIFVLGLSQWFQIVSPAGNAGSWFARQGIGRSLFGLLPPYYCYYCARRNSGAGRKICTAAFWFGIGFYFLVYALQWFGSAATWHSLRSVIYIVFEVTYGLCLWCTAVLEKGRSRRYRVLIGAGLAALMLGIGLENFTHIGYTAMRTARPMILGALAFSLLQATAVLFYVYDHVEEQARIARELSESRVRLMMNQLKPHFIRNSLATIRVITRHDPEKAYDLLYDFTQYLSYNIDSMRDTDLTTFGEELRHIREYTNIEEEHMRHRLRMVYEPGPVDFMIPPLSVEPFVENAVKHGVWPRREGGTVWVGSAEEEDAYVITVRDDGVGFDPDDPPEPAVSGHGIGMKYAAERIRAMTGGSVHIDSCPGSGTTVTIRIPKTDRGERG